MLWPLLQLKLKGALPPDTVKSIAPSAPPLQVAAVGTVLKDNVLVIIVRFKVTTESQPDEFVTVVV